MQIRSIIIAAAFALLPAGPAVADTHGLSVDQQIEMARSLNEARRQITVAANVELSEAAAETFWPVYRDYRAAVAEVDDELKAVILRYADSYPDIEGSTALVLSEDALKLQVKRDRLKQKYLKRFAKATSPMTAARVMQVENRLDLLAQLGLSESIPLVPAD